MTTCMPIAIAVSLVILAAPASAETYRVALKAKLNNQYVSVRSGNSIYADSSTLDAPQYFRLEYLEDNVVSIWSDEGRGYASLDADADPDALSVQREFSALEGTFEIIENADDSTISLRGYTGYYVNVESHYGQVLAIGREPELSEARFALEYLGPEERDSVELATGERLTETGEVPPRVNYLSTPFWDGESDDKLFEELSRWNGLAIVAFKSDRAARGYFKGVTYITEAEVENAQAELLAIADVYPVEASADFVMPIMNDGRRLPATVVQIGSVEALKTVREQKWMDYVEPVYFMDGVIGCGMPTYTPSGLLGETDVISGPIPGGGTYERIPYSYGHTKVPQAWNRFVGKAPGAGIKIAVVDTGVSQTQNQFHTFFNFFRTELPEHLSLVPSSPWDTNCGHGTRIAGLAAAPRDGRNIMGIAWGAPLLTMKIGSMVVTPSPSAAAAATGIKNAHAGGARVINMAFGSENYSSHTLEQAIVDVFDNPNLPPAILVGAAGTYAPITVFPANMNREVIAASTVEVDNATGSTFRLKTVPDNVAYDDNVDIVVPMGSGGRGVPTTGWVGNGVTEEISNIGGSSMATPHVSAAVALAWAEDPNATRDTIRNRVIQSGSLERIPSEAGYGVISPNVGFGLLDIYNATGGISRVRIDGPSCVASGTAFTLQAVNDGTCRFGCSYQWDDPNGSQFAHMNGTLFSGSRSYTVQILDRRDNQSFTANKTVFVGNCATTNLYSAGMLSEYPSLPFWGKAVDRVVNPNQTTWASCAVTGVRGQEMVWNGTTFVPSGPAVASKDNGNTGFRVSRPKGAAPNDLTVNVRAWHDGVSSIRLRIVYDVVEPTGTDCSIAGVTTRSL